jgi:hypothetical protein
LDGNKEKGEITDIQAEIRGLKKHKLDVRKDFDQKP